MNNRILFCLLGTLTLSVACNKNNPATPNNNTPANTAPVIDDVIGIYIGQNKYHKIDYAYAPGSGMTYYRDTSYTLADTVTIQKIGTDSFALVEPDWKVFNYSMHFKFDTSNVYKLRNPYTTGSAYDTIRIQLYPANDSIAIEKFAGTDGTSGYYRYKNDFSGKK